MTLSPFSHRAKRDRAKLSESAYSGLERKLGGSTLSLLLAYTFEEGSAEVLAEL
ncbi:MAG: hypothetical protein KME35_13230 [Aphanocapsa sp. GSE-SYN-MK-11-07L]|nr:hypothetical protein [Aphanocapsa sp. GSE-SYN-MK-11-07L]